MATFSKIQAPVKPVKVEVLQRCRKGLTKHINKERRKDKLHTLMGIREEVDWLIETLQL
jgi:hypothetical protein